MGARPSPRNKIIPKSEHQEHLMSLEEFQAQAAKDDVVVIDVRDPFQRANVPGPNIAGTINAPIDNLVKLIKSKKYQDKELLLYDAVGKQITWVHYYLKYYGYTRYQFLKGGVGHQG